MDISQIIQLAATLISSSAIVLILREQIKSQQEQINTMKGNIDSMKSFMDIFKVDEVEKYVEMSKKSVKYEAIKLAQDSVVDFMKNEHQFKELAEKTIRDSPFLAKHEELFNEVCEMLYVYPDDERERVIDDMFPENSEDIRLSFKEMREKHPTFFEERNKMSLKNLREILSIEAKNQNDDKK